MVLFARVADVLFPPACDACGAPGPWLCVRCRQPARPGWVLQAGERVLVADDPPASRATAALYALKYEGKALAAAPLASMLAATIASAYGSSARLALVPVPTSATRRRERGYDHAELLAAAVGASLVVPVLPLLYRTRATRQQVGLGREERIENVRGAFACAPLPVDALRARLVLVDDVCTTGATLAAAAAVVRAAGATRVGAAALFARTS